MSADTNNKTRSLEKQLASDYARTSIERVNRYLNTVLWLCTITGPAIALGVKSGIFNAVGYGICIFISCYMAVVSVVHLLILKKWPVSALSGMSALLAMDILLVMMAYAHVSIRITWFIIPMMSLLFVDVRIFCISVFVNYGFMLFSTWQTSFYDASQRMDYDSAAEYFFNCVGGLTIETLVMGGAAMALARVVTNYYSNLVDNYQELDSQKDALLRNDQMIKEDMLMLESMAGIYDHVNLLDFSEMTEVPLHDSAHQKRHFDFSRQTQTYLNQQLNKDLVDAQLPDFMTFTNILTVQGRLSGKKVIAKEFMNRATGWFRAQYINIDDRQDGPPDRVIYTVQNIDKDKRREEHLVRIAITDELTGLYNRRCFDNDIEEYEETEMDKDLVLISIDVNGLKTVNDTLGHAAGDELIKGAAFCAQLAYGTYGRVYRTGGDEFIAIISSDDCDFIQDTIYMMTDEWTGREVDHLSLSVGYAAHRDHPGEDIAGLVKIADAMMYEEKERHYRDTGAKRRVQG